MTSERRPRLTSAHVIAAAALFIALGGTAVALTRNSVGPRAIKADAVRNSKIADNAVHTEQIRDGSVGTNDIADNTVTGAKADESSFGQVPSSASAAALASQTKIDYVRIAVTAGEVIYEAGGLRLSAACAAGPALTLTANTTVDNATINTYGLNAPDTNDADFDSAETKTLTIDAEERDVVYTEPGGAVVVIQYAADEGTIYGTANTCLVKGLAQLL